MCSTVGTDHRTWPYPVNDCLPPQAVIASLEYTLEGHHGETPNPVSFGWVLAT
jgi:hypothetical protein